ncbi:MAG: hypothetical protein Q9203_005219, partial [Teloschistes exilis]
MPFQYKTVLMVGATSGIGAAMADRLIHEGSKVIAVGRRQDKLDDFVSKHGSAKAGAAKFDITDRQGMSSFVGKITKEFPDLDCVFLNAGTQSPMDLTKPEKYDPNVFDNEISTNFNSIVDLTMKFLPFFQAKKSESSFIFTGSHIAVVPAAGLPAYCASKAALNSFVLSLRLQLASAKSPVKIIEISPPVVKRSRLMNQSTAELHDYMGEEKGRSMGMPVDIFVDQTFKGLEAGKDQVPVGTILGTSEEDLGEIVDKRRAAAERLQEGLMKMMHGADIGMDTMNVREHRQSFEKLLRMSIRFAIIAGVGPGTGATVARKFASIYPVALLARNPANYEDAVRDIESAGGRAIGIPTDVTDAESVKNAVETARKEFGSNSVAAAVFNVGGRFIKKPFLELTQEEFE